MKTQILLANGENISKCGEMIRAGEIVAFPTETVYGLGANAFDALATDKIFKAKGRPATNPLIIHVSDKSQIGQVAEVDSLSEMLIEALMPGALTLVLPKKDVVPSIVTAGNDTVAVRMPDHPVALSLIKEAGVPVCAPSANTSSRPSPTTADHVYDDLCGKIPVILDGGKCPFGLESTIINMTETPPRVLRAGSVDIAEVEQIIGSVNKSSVMTDQLSELKKPMHFVPQAELVFSAYYEGMSVTINSYFDRMTMAGRRPIIFCMNSNAGKYDDRAVMSMGDTVKAYAGSLFEKIREVEKNHDLIIAEGVPLGGIGTTLLTRLMKLSNGNVI
ncbi:MAG: threonylcarbamoyl-AMP synthase [Clostridia bacterium]|nr:threonylcarbamoyl-AMP synthase [Clostridia bacterium]